MNFEKTQMSEEDFFKELESDITPYEHPANPPIPESKKVENDSSEKEEVKDEGDLDLEQFIDSPKSKNKQVETEDGEEEVEEAEEEVDEAEEVSDEDRMRRNLFKATAELLQEQLGIDKEDLDLDALSDEDWTAETFKELVSEFVSYGAESIYNNHKNSNEEIKAILELVENGGNIGMLDAYRDRRQAIDDIDVSTTEGKIHKIRTYYKQIEGKSNEEIDEWIEFIQTKNSIDKELAKVNNNYEKHFAAEREEIVERQKQFAERKRLYEENIAQQFEKLLDNEQYDKKTKSELSSFAFQKVAKIVSTGETISSLEKRIIEMKRNPAELLELAKFLKDIDKYKQEIITKHNNNKTVSTFDKLYAAKNKPKGKVTKPKNTLFKF